MSGDETLKILFFGDLVGRPGRYAIRDFIAKPKYFLPDSDYDFDKIFCIANVENASHGFGLTEKNYHDLESYGIDCMTSGNHIWDKKEIFTYIDNADKLIRPFNYPAGTKGQGSKIFEFNGIKIGVVNALGRVFMAPVDSPWQGVLDEIKRLKEITPVVLVDFHAEATAEKICLARLCSEVGVSAFFGTHTHVQTADEQILNGMAYITDAGFCGAYDSVIGMDYSSSLIRFTTCVPKRYDVADSKLIQLNAVEVEITPSTGQAATIKRIFCCIDKINEDERQ